jgi:tryptophan synthase beta chain
MNKQKYSLGSVLNHVLLHQTIIGQEAIKQFEKTDDFPDTVIGCFGGGSNFAGISFPFIRKNIKNGSNIKIIAVEPESCPKLTRGVFHYDFGDTIGLTPLIPMYTLGHNFYAASNSCGRITISWCRSYC